MQEVPAGSQYIGQTMNFVKGLQDENREKTKRSLETVVGISVGLLAWNVYRNHSGKRRP